MNDITSPYTTRNVLPDRYERIHWSTLPHRPNWRSCMKQFVDIVYRFRLQKQSKSENFAHLTAWFLTMEYVSRWGQATFWRGLISPKLMGPKSSPSPCLSSPLLARLFSVGSVDRIGWSDLFSLTVCCGSLLLSPPPPLMTSCSASDLFASITR